MTEEERRGARVILRDGLGRLLLFRGGDPALAGDSYWFTPGGGIEPGESAAEAARRELYEETGHVVLELGDIVHEDYVEFSLDGVIFRQTQRFFAVSVAGPGSEEPLDESMWTDIERRSVVGYKWWDLDELEASGERFYPEDLRAVVESVRTWGAARPAPT